MTPAQWRKRARERIDYAEIQIDLARGALSDAREAAQYGERLIAASGIDCVLAELFGALHHLRVRAAELHRQRGGRACSAGLETGELIQE